MVKQSEDGTDSLYQNVWKYQYTVRNLPEEQKISFTEVTHMTSYFVR
jgi:hypothetical protein